MAPKISYRGIISKKDNNSKRKAVFLPPCQAQKKWNYNGFYSSQKLSGAILCNCRHCSCCTDRDSSVVIDVHPEEENQVIELIDDINRNLKLIIDSRFDIDFNVPLLLEAKIGVNWLDQQEV